MNKYFYLLLISVLFGNIFIYAGDKCVDPRNILGVVTEDWKCDINLLTGRGSRDGKSFASSSRAIAIEGWSEMTIPKECQ